MLALERCPLAVEEFIRATIAVAQTGVPVMRRVLPEGAVFRIWDHFPDDDAVDAESGSRWFYHAHEPNEGWHEEHGHFHLFLSRDLFEKRAFLAAPVERSRDKPELVHVAAISIDQRGVPIRLFSTNRWATDEWLYPAGHILDRLRAFDLSQATGDPLVNAWLTAALPAFLPELRVLLHARDQAIAGRSTSFFEARRHEVLSSVDLDLALLG